MGFQTFPKTAQKLQKQPKHLTSRLFFFMIENRMEKLQFYDFLDKVKIFLKPLSLFPNSYYSIFCD